MGFTASHETVVTPRRRVEIALRGGAGDRIPFTMYENKIPQCSAERCLRNRGLCIVKRDVPVYRMRYASVKVTQQTTVIGDKQQVRTFYETPHGTLTTRHEPAGFTSWWHEKMFKSPEDYKALLYLIRDERYEPCYAEFAAAQEAFGEDAIFRAGIGAEPLQALISGQLMGMQDFAIEWMDHRDEILRLYEALVENRRRVYPLVAQSPALHANYGGNVVSSLIGREVFERYYVPHYNEAAEVMHRHGKLLGCHFDDHCRLLADAIAGTPLDYLEAFTPSPDTDMTVAEARAVWRDKVLWINFPSSQHLKPDEEIERIAFDLAEQAGALEGFLVGITEDIPADRWQNSCQAIMDGLDRHARQRHERYGPAVAII